MIIIKIIEKFLFESTAWKFVLTIAIITCFKTGIWYIPNIVSSQAISQNPFVNPFENVNGHYLFWSWLGPFLAWVVGATGRWSFFAFHFLFSAGFSVLFFTIVFRNFSSDHARSSLILFSALPVSATAYFWVGLDSITLFLMLLALAYTKSQIFTLFFGVLLGMQHFEQSFFAAAGLLFAVYLSNKQGYPLNFSVRFCIWLFLGVIIGKLTLIVIFTYYSIELHSSRIDWLLDHLRELFRQFVFHIHYIIWSVLGVGWFAALRYVDWGRKSVPFFVTLAGLCLLLLPVSEDQTRVLAIVTFPLVCVYWLFNEDFLQKLQRWEVSLMFVAWTMIPWGWVWRGLPKWSVFPYDIGYILHNLFGWFNVPPNPALWPF